MSKQGNMKKNSKNTFEFIFFGHLLCVGHLLLGSGPALKYGVYTQWDSIGKTVCKWLSSHLGMGACVYIPISVLGLCLGWPCVGPVNAATISVKLHRFESPWHIFHTSHIWNITIAWHIRWYLWTVYKTTSLNLCPTCVCSQVIEIQLL